MEPTENHFSLITEMITWQQNMQNRSLTADDVTELTQHLVDEVASLKTMGLDDEEAWMVASHRIGQPLVIDAEFCKVNPNFTANRNLLMLFWGASIFMTLQSLFFAFPNILWFILSGHAGLSKHLLSVDNTLILLYVFIAVTTMLSIFSVSKPGTLSAWFNNLITKYSGRISIILITLGAFVATWNYKTISHNFLGAGQISWGIDSALDLLAFTFYGSLIFCTTWFTIRYQSEEFRNFKNFSTSFNWKMSFIMGIMIELTICFCNSFHLLPINFIMIVLLFGSAGYIIGYSKTVMLNLFMTQACALFVFCITYFSAHQPIWLCTSIYLTTIAMLFTGCTISKKRTENLQTT